MNLNIAIRHYCHFIYIYFYPLWYLWSHAVPVCACSAMKPALPSTAVWRTRSSPTGCASPRSPCSSVYSSTPWQVLPSTKTSEQCIMGLSRATNHVAPFLSLQVCTASWPLDGRLPQIFWCPILGMTWSWSFPDYFSEYRSSPSTRSFCSWEGERYVGQGVFSHLSFSPRERVVSLSISGTGLSSWTWFCVLRDIGEE